MTETVRVRRTLLELAVLAVLVTVPLLWRIAVGASSVPAGDAWAYERIFLTLHRTGHVQLVNWNDITLVGMLPVAQAWSWVFGASRASLHVLGTVVCFVGLCGARRLFAACSVPTMISTCLLAASAAFVSVAGTFLSDPFSFAGAAWALALSATAVRSDRLSQPLALTCAVGAALCASFAFMVRQQTVSATLAALLILWAGRARVPRGWLCFAITFTLVCGPLYLWRSTLTNGGSVHLSLRLGGVAAGLQGMYLTLGLLGAAVAVAQHRLRRSQLLAVVLLGGVAYLCNLLLWHHVDAEANPLVVGIRTASPTWLAEILILIVCLLAAVGWVEALGRLGWTVRHRSGRTVSAALVLVVALEAMTVVLTGSHFGRYSMVSATLLVLLLWCHAPRRAPAIAAVAVLFASSLWVLDRSVSPARAVTDAAATARCLGIAPANVDGGFTWNGVHFNGIASTEPDDARPDGLPPTASYNVFRTMERTAVLTEDRPPSSSSYVVYGPFRSSGLLPGTGATAWLAVRAGVGANADCGAAAPGPA